MGSRTGIVTLALVRDTFREAFARKIFWGFFGCSTAVILFFVFLMKIDVVEGALATVSLFGKEMRSQEVTDIVRGVQGALAAFLYGFGLFLAVFASAGLIPTIFEPGRIELRPTEAAPRDLANRLGQLLSQWTGQRWLVSVSAEAGQPTLREAAELRERVLRSKAAQHPLVRAVLETFPGARIEAVRTRDEGDDTAPAPDPGDGVADGNEGDEI